MGGESVKWGRRAWAVDRGGGGEAWAEVSRGPRVLGRARSVGTGVATWRRGAHVVVGGKVADDHTCGHRWCGLNAQSRCRTLWSRYVVGASCLTAHQPRSRL